MLKQPRFTGGDSIWHTPEMNVITYSMLNAGLLRAQIDRRPHRLTVLLSFARLDRH